LICVGSVLFAQRAGQIEYHPYVAKAAAPLIDYCQKHGIIVTAYGGLTPITRHQGGPLDSVLASIRKRVSDTRGSPVTDAQVLFKWLKQRDIVVITYVFLQQSVTPRAN
jgi:diketogulonate reductase-like aldo/keto reductase